MKQSKTTLQPKDEAHLSALTMFSGHGTIKRIHDKQDIMTPLKSQWIGYCLHAFLQCFYALSLSLINPVVIAISFAFLFDKLSITSDNNIASIPIKLVPVWIAAGMGTYVAVSLILFLILRATAKLSFTQFASVNILAHLPFIPFCLFSWLLITEGMEWNLMGFITVPLFILMTAILIPVSFFVTAIAIRKVRRGQNSITSLGPAPQAKGVGIDRERSGDVDQGSETGGVRASQPLPAGLIVSASTPPRVSIVLPTYNERGNIEPLLAQLLPLQQHVELEILVVDDDSADGTAELVRQLAHGEPRLRLIRRVGRSGLASAIKEGLLDATGDWAIVMDSDGQHEPASVLRAIETLLNSDLDLVIGSRFHPEASILGLSGRRETGSNWANAWARFSLPPRYSQLSDYMSGFFALRLQTLLPFIRAVDVNGFKFLYELLAVSRGRLQTAEVPLQFQPRHYGSSKLDLAIFWDFLISILHSLSLRLMPRRAISFGLVGASGVIVQLVVTQTLMMAMGLGFERALPIAVVAAASSNYLINNALTFRFQRLKGAALLRGLLKFLLVASLPVLANVGLASAYYSFVARDTFWAQLAGILVVFVWNYAASSRFVWNTP